MRSLRGPGGEAGGLDLGSYANICAQELASVASRVSPLASPGLPWPPLASRVSPVASRVLQWPPMASRDLTRTLVASHSLL